MKKTGRPRLEEKKKTHRVSVFFTMEDFAKIQLNARRAGLGGSGSGIFTSDRIGKRGKTRPLTANFAAVKEINAISKNLNSLVRAALTFKTEDAAGITDSIKRTESSLHVTIGRLLERKMAIASVGKSGGAKGAIGYVLKTDREKNQ